MIQLPSTLETTFRQEIFAYEESKQMPCVVDARGTEHLPRECKEEGATKDLYTPNHTEKGRLWYFFDSPTSQYEQPNSTTSYQHL